MKQIVLILSSAVTLSACTDIPYLGVPPWQRQPEAVTEPAGDGTLPAPDTVEVSELPDATEKPVPGPSGLLGTTVATLGDPAREGFWIETPLVAEPGKGRVRYPANGREVRVDLIPIAGAVTAGSRLSLGAMRLLDAPLTGLPEVEVYLD
ncbi:MAG: hypothetical protein R3256_08025 [Thalassovita sp.]|nr:hypothetical protein [Thalassovita sp.]